MKAGSVLIRMHDRSHTPINPHTRLQCREGPRRVFTVPRQVFISHRGQSAMRRPTGAVKNMS